MIKNFSDYTSSINEKAEVYGKTLSFRELMSLVRKQFPGIIFKISSPKRVYYSPHEDDMKLFSLGGIYWLPFPSKTISIEKSKEGKIAIEIAKFLQKNKVAAWTNCENDSTQWGKPEIHVFDTTSVKEVKKMEKDVVKKYLEKEREEEQRVNRKKEESGSREKYKELYDKLKPVPLGVKISVPSSINGVGDIALLSLNSHQSTWRTWGSIVTYDSSSKEDVEELSKIIDYIYNNSPLKTMLISKKFGI